MLKLAILFSSGLIDQKFTSAIKHPLTTSISKRITGPPELLEIFLAKLLRTVSTNQPFS